MEKLTLKQKQIIIGTNHYIGQFNHHINEDAYGDTSSYKILDRWISEILDVDYRNDIYNNMAVSQLNRIDSVKNAFSAKFKEGWFIGDALKSSLYTLVHYNRQEPELIAAKEQELKDMWAYFKSLVPELYPPKSEPDEKLAIAIETIKWLRMQVDNPNYYNTVMTDKIDEALNKIEVK